MQDLAKGARVLNLLTYSGGRESRGTLFPADFCLGVCRDSSAEACSDAAACM